MGAPQDLQRGTAVPHDMQREAALGSRAEQTQ